VQQTQHLQIQQRLQEQSSIQSHHNLNQQRVPLEHQVQQQCLQSSISSSEQAGTNMESSNTCSSNDNSQSSCESQQNKQSSRNGKSDVERYKKKKKGGKAKGTLETSVEIRNRMIGMSEAGLSTLSIALAIDRSVRKMFYICIFQLKLNGGFLKQCII